MCDHKVVNGTHYHIRLLESLRRDDALRSYYRVHYGDTQTGKDWLEECYVFGHVGRSCGPCKIPLLVAPNASGAPGMLEHCIVRIRKGSRDLYRHPKYHHPKLTKTKSDIPDYPVEVRADGKTHARFKSERVYRLWVTRMGVSISV